MPDVCDRCDQPGPLVPVIDTILPARWRDEDGNVDGPPPIVAISHYCQHCLQADELADGAA